MHHQPLFTQEGLIKVLHCSLEPAALGSIQEIQHLSIDELQKSNYNMSEYIPHPHCAALIIYKNKKAALG